MTCGVRCLGIVGTGFIIGANANFVARYCHRMRKYQRTKLNAPGRGKSEQAKVR